MRHKYRMMIAAGYLLGCALVAQENRLLWHGFMSVGGGMTLGDDEVYMADYPSAASYDDHADFSPDTVFGLQVQANAGEGLSATTQVVARGGQDFDACFEWAYLSYEITDELTASAGRKRYPFFYYSETLDLGYSYHWIRPPTDVYNYAITTYEGGSLRHKTALGVLDSKLDLWGGRTTADVSTLTDVEMDLKNIGGIAWKIGYNEMISGRLVYTFATIDFIHSSGALISEGNDTSFYGAALDVELEHWFLISEYTTVQFEKNWNDVHNWYVSTGIRIGPFTPHVTVGEWKERISTSAPEEQRSVTVGLRYDFHPSAAFKIEFSTIQDRSDPPERISGDSDLVSMAVDVMF